VEVAMGCDIHPYIEVNEGKRDDDAWGCYFDMDSTPCWPRYYSFWYALAGVRSGNVEPLDELIHRGVPKHCDQGVKDAMRGLHSISWVTPSELRRVIENYDATEPDGLKAPVEFRATLAAMEEIEKVFPVRFVFGFDN
jgi:hypothetical protein